jgi:DNA-binding NtrC family response regulator
VTSELRPGRATPGDAAPRGSILVVDDDPLHLRAMRTLFERKGWSVVGAANPWDALAAYERERCDVVLLDLDLPQLSGLRLLELMRERDPDVVVLMLTGRGDIAHAVEAMQAGAENFLTKPVNPAHLLAATERAREKGVLRRRTRSLLKRQDTEGEELGESPVMRTIAGQLTMLADGSAPVLLTGETGTGKSWAARYLHKLSSRADQPFIEVNCAGLSATFLDSELFGHERGAFTDAKTQKLGLFELADGGTVFLDEIGDLSPDLQPKLLRVLETQRFRRLGGTREIQVDVRLVAATHRDLAAAVAETRFRQDLYYRLAVYPVHLPPLRARGCDDVTLMAARALAEVRQRLGRGPTRFEPETIDLLCRYPWPGNIRELRNIVERLVLVAMSDEAIGPQHLPAELLAAAGGGVTGGDDRDLTLATAERRHIERVLAMLGNNRTRAARALGISRATLYNWLGRDG